MAQVEVSDFHEGLFVEDVHGLRFHALNILKRNVGKTKEDVAAELCRQLGVVKCPPDVVGEAVGESLAANPVDSPHDYQVAKASPKGRETQRHVKHPSNSSGGQSREVSESKGSAESPDSRQLEIAVNPNRASLRRREMLDADKAAVPSLSPVVDVFSVPASVALPRRGLRENMLVALGRLEDLEA